MSRLRLRPAVRNIKLSTGKEIKTFCIEWKNSKSQWLMLGNNQCPFWFTNQLDRNKAMEQIKADAAAQQETTDAHQTQ